MISGYQGNEIKMWEQPTFKLREMADGLCLQKHSRGQSGPYIDKQLQGDELQIDSSTFETNAMQERLATFFRTNGPSCAAGVFAGSYLLTAPVLCQRWGRGKCKDCFDTPCWTRTTRAPTTVDRPEIVFCRGKVEGDLLRRAPSLLPTSVDTSAIEH